MTGLGIMFREHAMLKNHYSARCNTMMDAALTNLVTRIPVTTQGHRKLYSVQSQQISATIDLGAVTAEIFLEFCMSGKISRRVATFYSFTLRSMF